MHATVSPAAETLSVRPASSQDLLLFFCSVRQQTETLCLPLTPEDMMVQSCPEASPVKWHLAHTTWFFETFVLTPYLEGYRPFHPDFVWLFNSYYNSVSDQPLKKLRACFSRPSLEEIRAYRHHVDAAVERLLESSAHPEAVRRITIGVHHEQQHQELLAYDVKNAFWVNPLHAAYRSEPLAVATEAPPVRWIDFPGGLVEIGHRGEGFSFDNERPRHRHYLEPYTLASRLVTCGEYLDFMRDGGYQRPELWLSEGWETVKAQQWSAPLYWFHGDDGEWQLFTLAGAMPLAAMLATPVCHVSYFEADAFARWAGKRLPTEQEWEAAAETIPEPATGNFLESGELHPMPASSGAGLQQMYGDLWEWTASAYLGYPGFAAEPGALGEYNGKFMCNQMVLRGGSAVTPASHIRSTYRNFFSPDTRWQFAGLRLANR
ncbi:ergothioneine biosynthesis protein EgtB [Silvibacterium dinghuense]|uniref:Ergothioneine biosynthesis protein EgtB n=1 Tax=Silvibacterium dinghuense TaxID=1560006 RepID=A0A4Q1SIA5_9BACT|nr:ergothioneine biosynthesis protein EgtB [Silvibacterium dinghuense]RXS97109.1 ergothioneine biosynthesis protein EgtB [Silvibacterium dinghuense]GGG96307.1 ergothioneine biosynthesis protein EgtB [Silvibacterium dinghuense]